MKSIADVNVVFPILVAWHVHHGAAWRWWETQGDETVALCWPVRMAVLRLLTHALAMNGKPVSTDQALGAWDEFTSDPRTCWIESPPPSHEAVFRSRLKGRTPSPNLWTDAWLAALAVSLGHRMTSFDAGFRSFELLNFEHLTG